MARGGEERARGEPLLTALRLRPDERLGAPNLRLDIDLVEAIATHGRLREARIVARALDMSGSVLGLELLHALELVLGGIPPGEPPEVALLYGEAVTQGSAIVAQRVALSPDASPEVRRRAQTLVQLLRGFRALTAPTTAPEPLTIDPAVRRVVAEMISRRDLLWGRQALEPLSGAEGGAELLDSVTRMLTATERVAHEEVGTAATAPIEDRGVVQLHLRMLNLEPAERGLRRLCVEHPEQHDAPALLRDVVRLRAVLEGSPSEGRASQTPSAPKAAPPEWLNKRSRKASVEGWAASQKRAPTPVPYEEAATSVLRPDDEAELHIRAGRPDKAVELYRRLAERYPDRPRFRERADEIEAQMSARELSFADEMTVRRDLRPLAASTERAVAPPAVSTPPAPPALEAPLRAHGGVAPSDDAGREVPTEEAALDLSSEVAFPEESTETSPMSAILAPIPAVLVRPIVSVR